MGTLSDDGLVGLPTIGVFGGLLSEIYGIIGQDLSSSLSKEIHTYSMKRLGIDASYEVIEVDPSRLIASLRDFSARGGVGLSVTSPYKLVIEHALRASEILEGKHPLNTAKKTENGWELFNTDSAGFECLLKQGLEEEKYPTHWLVLGNGSMSHLVVETLSKMSSPEKELCVDVMARDQRKASWRTFCLDSNLECDLRLIPWSLDSFEAWASQSDRDFDLCVINTCSSLSPSNSFSIIESLNDYRGYLFDLNYSDRSIENVAKKPLNSFVFKDGLSMLIEQARKAQMSWWGRTVSFEDIEEHLRSKMV